jgi:hypothetical protein
MRYGKKLIGIIVLALSISTLQSPTAFSEEMVLNIIEEDRLVWDNLLKDGSIKTKNLLYASYIAYKDRLCDLSIETFMECIKRNQGNDLIKGVASYYIGKNMFLLGKYSDAIVKYQEVHECDMAKFNYVKFAVLINTAIAYHRIKNLAKFREILGIVIGAEGGENYKKIASEILSKNK